ncbi:MULTISPECIES: hypothetical protein [Actinomycetes]|uniref:hypothetical protein n=1 Tax=Actinomycetes TaxID=1760 RepID=UPI000B0B9722|nr:MULTISPECIES: hypothetical protein [Actinomycetes]
MTEIITNIDPRVYVCEFCEAVAELEGGTVADVLARRPGVSHLTIRHESWCPYLRTHQSGNRAARRAARRGGQR